MAAPAKKKKYTSQTTGDKAPSRAANANNGTAGGKNPRKLVLALAIAAIALAFVFMVANVGGFAKRGVERAASAALGVPVAIAALDISLQNREIDVAGIRVFNPEGYSNAAAVDVGSVKIAAEQIDQKLLVFSQINVSDAKILFETTAQGSNMTQLRARGKASQDSAAPAGDDDVKVIVRELIISNATLQPAGLAAGVSDASLTLPDIRITGIGVQENGVSVPIAMGHITDALTVVAVKAAMERGLTVGIAPETLQLIQQDLGIQASLMDQVRGIGDRVKGLFGEGN